MNRRDFLLQQMQIPQWKLQRPEVLKGVVNMPIGNHIRLIIVAEQEVDLSHSLLQDILRSIELLPTDCLSISFDFITHLNLKHKVNYWLLNNNLEKIQQAIPYCTNALQQWKTPDLFTLQQNPQLKRDLWKQIQQVC